MFNSNRLNLLCCSAIMFVIAGCSFQSSKDEITVVNKPIATATPTPTATPYVYPSGFARDGLDLASVAELAKTAKDARDLEKQVNKKDGVNNLDLNRDYKVDYISVAEIKINEGTERGYSLYVKFAKDKIQEVLTLIIERESPEAETIKVAVVGNEQIYGVDESFEGEWESEEAYFDDWAYSDHEYYESVYYFDNYPSGFYISSVAAWEVYRVRTDRWRKGSKFKRNNTLTKKTKLVSPNTGKTVTDLKAKLRKPTEAQKIYTSKRNTPAKPKTVTVKKQSPPTSTSSSTTSSTYPNGTSPPPHGNSPPPYSSATPRTSSTPYRTATPRKSRRTTKSRSRRRRY